MSNNDENDEEDWDDMSEGTMTFANAKKFLTRNNVNKSAGGKSTFAMVLHDDPEADQMEVLDYFLKFGFDINEVASCEGFHPGERFHSEVTLIHREMLYLEHPEPEMLLKLGIPDIRDSFGDTPLTIAAHWYRRHNDNAPKVLACECRAKHLIDYGAKIENISADVKVPQVFKRLSNSRSSCKNAIMTVMAIWLYRRKDCCDTFGLIDRPIVKMILMLIWGKRFDLDLEWCPVRKSQAKKMKSK